MSQYIEPDNINLPFNEREPLEFDKIHLPVYVGETLKSLNKIELKNQFINNTGTITTIGLMLYDLHIVLQDTVAKVTVPNPNHKEIQNQLSISVKAITDIETEVKQNWKVACHMFSTAYKFFYDEDMTEKPLNINIWNTVIDIVNKDATTLEENRGWILKTIKFQEMLRDNDKDKTKTYDFQTPDEAIPKLRELVNLMLTILTRVEKREELEKSKKSNEKPFRPSNKNKRKN